MCVCVCVFKSLFILQMKSMLSNHIKYNPHLSTPGGSKSDDDANASGPSKIYTNAFVLQQRYLQLTAKYIHAAIFHLSA